jgi:hypothetical protein
MNIMHFLSFYPLILPITLNQLSDEINRLSNWYIILDEEHSVEGDRNSA